MEKNAKDIGYPSEKRKKWSEEIDSISLIKETNGFNGADLEAVVKDTIELALLKERRGFRHRI